MSRLDYFTIAIVAVCILAIVFLLYKTTDIFGGKDEPVVEEQLPEDGPSEEIYEDPYLTEQEDSLRSVAENEGDNIILDEEKMANSPDEIAPETTTPAPKEDNDDYAAPSSSGSGDFLVLAGSFTVKENAENYAAQIQKKGYNDAVVVLFNGGKYATVLVDRYAGKSAADDLVERLRTDGVEAYVHRKREQPR